MALAERPPGAESAWLGHFGERWFQVLCSTAGCTTAKPTPDLVGADFLVSDQASETIRVQVKTTERAQRTATGYRYDLDVATYDRLRHGATVGYLALVVVHAPRPHWTRHRATSSLVRAAAYWACLGERPATPNRSSVSVPLPATQMLTPPGLLSLFPGSHCGR